MLYIHPECTILHGATKDDVLQLCGNGEQVSRSSCSAVWKSMIGNDVVFIKKYDYPYSWKYFLRPSKAYCEWKNYRFFEQQNIACAKVLCYAERRILGRLRWAILITLGIPDAIDLWKLFQQSKQYSFNQETRLEIIQELAQKIAQLHNEGFCHRDFKLRNVLCIPHSKEKNKLFLIDCPRGGGTWRFPEYIIRKDLSELYRYAKQVWAVEEWKYFLQEYKQNSKRKSLQLDEWVNKIF